MKYLLTFIFCFLLTLAGLFTIPGIQARSTKRLLMYFEDNFGIEVRGEATWTLLPPELHLENVVFDSLHADAVHIGFASVDIESLSGPQLDGINAKGSWWLDFDLHPLGTLEANHFDWGALQFSFSFKNENKKRELSLQLSADGQFGRLNADGFIAIPRMGLKTAIVEGRSLFARFKMNWESENFGSALGYVTLGWENLGLTIPSLEIAGTFFNTPFTLEGSGELQHPLIDLSFFPTSGPLIDPKVFLTLYRNQEVWEGHGTLIGVFQGLPLTAFSHLKWKEWESLFIKEGTLAFDGGTGSFEAQWDFANKQLDGTLTLATPDLSSFITIEGDLLAKAHFAIHHDQNFYPVDPKFSLQLYSHRLKKGNSSLLEGEATLTYEEKKGVPEWSFISLFQQLNLWNESFEEVSVYTKGPIGELIPLYAECSQKDNPIWLDGQASFSFDGLHLFLNKLEGSFHELPLSLEETTCLSFFKDGWNLDRLHLQAGDRSLKLYGHGGEGKTTLTGALKGLTCYDLPISPLAGQFNAEIQGLTAEIEGSFTGAGGELIDGDISVLLVDDYPLDGHVQFRGELSPYLSIILPNTTSISGLGAGQFNISGTAQDPHFGGKLTLRKGIYEDLVTGMLYSEMECDFLLRGDQVHIEGFRAVDRAGGLILGEGEWTISKDIPFVVYLESVRGEVIHLDYALARASGKIRLSGNREGGSFEGELKIDEATIRLPEKTPLLFQKLDIVYEKIQPEEEKVPWKLLWDLNIDFQAGVNVSSGIFKSEWRGNTSFQGTTDSPLLFGKGALVNASFNFNGKNFESTDGVILFQGEPGSKTSFYITAKQEVEDLKVEIILKGPLKSPEIAFRSNPPKPTKEILSYILLNRGTGAEEFTDLSESAIKLDTTPADISLLDKFKSTLGIDRIEISGAEEESLSLEVGKYILPGLYFCLKKSVSDGPNQAAVVAKFPHHFKAQGEVGDDAEGKFMLKWERDY